jgi:glutamate synthase (ferredoxin)
MTNFVNDGIQVGVIPMDESKVVMKGRLGPGMMITVDLQTGQVRI